jgi:DNA-binding NtrC family response regulator
MAQAAQTYQSFSELYSRAVGRILILDDDANLRFTYRQALRHAGYEVYSAATSQKARNLLKAYHFDVFIGDTHLNGNDRYMDLLREQSAKLTKNGTQIIMMSCDVQYQPLCEKMGASVSIEKSLAIDRLIALVDRLVGRQ